MNIYDWLTLVTGLCIFAFLTYAVWRVGKSGQKYIHTKKNN